MTPVVARQLWDEKHRFCADDSVQEADRVLSTHAGHGTSCAQVFAANAYSAERREQIECGGAR